MRHRIRQLLGLEPSKSVGRWFSVILLIGIAAAVYSSVTDWPHLHGTRRMAMVVKVITIVLFGAVIIFANEKIRRLERSQPPA